MMLFLAALGLLQTKSAEEVLQKIEETLSRAKRISCEYKAAGDDPSGTPLLLGTGILFMKDQDTCRWWGGENSSCILSPERAVFRKGAGVKTLGPISNIRDVVAANFVRGGGCLGLLPLKEGRDVDQMETLKVRNLIREPDSAGSGALTFEITIVDKAPPATVTLWYDLRTHLPSKRRLVYLQGDDQVRVTEVYQTWTLGTDIPDRFEHLAAKWALKAHSERVLLTQSVLALSATAIDLYRLDHNCFPARLEDLREAPPEIDRRKYPPGGYLLRILKDGWGRDLVYRVPGSSRQPYDLISLGEDGKEGGEGNALDLRNPGTLPKK